MSPYHHPVMFFVCYESKDSSREFCLEIRSCLLTVTWFKVHHCYRFACFEVSSVKFVKKLCNISLVWTCAIRFCSLFLLKSVDTFLYLSPAKSQKLWGSGIIPISFLVLAWLKVVVHVFFLKCKMRFAINMKPIITCWFASLSFHYMGLVLVGLLDPLSLHLWWVTEAQNPFIRSMEADIQVLEA